MPSGTFLAEPLLVDLGAALWCPDSSWPGAGCAQPSRRWILPRLRAVGWTYRGALLTLLVSLPVGMALAHLRAAG